MEKWLFVSVTSSPFNGQAFGMLVYSKEFWIVQGMGHRVFYCQIFYLILPKRVNMITIPWFLSYSVKIMSRIDTCWIFEEMVFLLESILWQGLKDRYNSVSLHLYKEFFSIFQYFSNLLMTWLQNHVNLSGMDPTSQM